MVTTIAPLRNPQSNQKLDPQDNHLLAALSPEVQARLFPQMELVPLELRSVLNESGEALQYAYFPADSIISRQYLLSDGKSTALSVVGNEGVLGITILLGFEPSISRSLVQSPGHAYRIPKSAVKAEFDRHGELMLLVLRYTQAVITQVSQTAICNRHHSIYEQVCRWILLSLDRLAHNRVTMTQEFIGDMLGVRRETVTAAATKLRQAKIIRYARGVIQVLDRPALEKAACECYETVRSETAQILRYVPQRRAVLDDPVPVVTLRKSAVGAPRGVVAQQTPSEFPERSPKVTHRTELARYRRVSSKNAP